MINVDEKYWVATLGSEVHFGNGLLKMAGSLIGARGKKRFLIVCGKSAHRFGFTQRLVADLGKFSDQVVIYDEICQDPGVDNVKTLLGLVHKNKIDSVIGLGGGSSMDAAKAVSVLGNLNMSLEMVLSEGLPPVFEKIDCIAIPTTAGTGSELSQGAILTWGQEGKKVGIRGPQVTPDLVIVDPDLTLSMLPRSTAITGFDVFTHAVETYISKRSNPLVEIYSLIAIRGVARYLPRLLEDLGNLHWRTQMSFFSMLMGYNLAHSSTCLPHRLQYPLGVQTGTEHATGLAALYPAWLKLTSFSSEDKFSRILQILNEEFESKEESIELGVKKLLINIGLTPRLSDFGVSESDCYSLASRVSGSLDNDPWWKPGVDLSQFYKMSL